MPIASTSPTKSERTRQQILEAAAKVLSERGYAATRLSDIARAADVQAPAIYYYWPSRTELITEVVRRGNILMVEHVASALARMDDGASPMERIVLAAGEHLRGVLEISYFATASTRAMGQLPPEIRGPQLEVQEQYAELWRALIADAQRSGELRADLDPSIARMLVLGALNWVPEWWDPDKGTLDDLIVTTESLVRGALG